MTVRWKEPPPKKSTSWAEVGRVLRTQPGVWACISERKDETSAINLVAYLRWGRKERGKSGLGQGVWQVTRSGRSVYARYCGPSVPSGGERG